MVGIVATIALLTGRTGATDHYHSIYKNVTGVKFGTIVLYEGYPIGQVEDVIPVAKGGAMKFMVNYTVKKDWKIPDDSKARIGASGLLAAITINIDAGVSPKAYIPGAEIFGKEAADILAVVGEVAGKVSNIAQNDIRPLLATIDKTVEILATTIHTVGTLVDEDGTKMIKTFSLLAQQMNASIPGVLKNLEASTENFAVLSKDLSQTRAKLDSILNKGDGILGDNQNNIRKSIQELRQVTSSLSRHIDSVNQNIEGTARNMYEFSREIRKNPGVLLSGGAPKDKGGK
ncbi:MAG: MCE family protein [Magnetovibrio sp.]|nr:MCE family protein [Magnetovibrio sp.]